MKILIFILFFLQACGHEQNFLNANLTDSPPNQTTPPPSLSEAAPCQGFIEDVVRFQPGAGAGFGQSRMPDLVLGPPRGGSETLGGLDVLALGSGGHIIVDTFPCEIADEEGVDFIVFENAFYIGGDPENPFAELARVSVSEDGENFVSFPCEDEAFPFTGCAGWRPVLSHPSNGISPFDVEAAGGDPFDLTEIGVAQARYIRIDDLASGGGFPPSVGFDLDAIAVMNGNQQGGTL
ncbi:MAG: cell surface protein [Deltaproteobacteria bacterium]|nr:cell surface protein [Deltaproteobacteria bacterium]